mmetsp:Transcript_23688/g.49176  ORF Transcript_23688/g.49176 Transcript_23688/m.49176 type:complete len:256 (+) Transcript_23688:156-923(+)
MVYKPHREPLVPFQSRQIPLWKCKLNVFCLLRLVFDSLNACPDGFLVTQISTLQRSDSTRLRDGFQIFIQFVHQRSSGRNVQFGNGSFINAIQMFDQGSQRVSVGGHQDGLATLDFGSNVGVPVGHDTVQGGGQRFGEFFREIKSGITFIIGGVVFAGLVHDGWGDIVRTTPDQDLVLAILIDRFLLVQSLQGTVVTFVQFPRLGDGDPHAFALFQNVPQGANGALQQGGESHFGLESFLLNQLTSLLDFFVTLG